MNFEWIKQIDNLEKHLKIANKGNVDLNLVFDILMEKSGVEAYIALYSTFLKTNVRFPETTIKYLRRVYVHQNITEIPAQTLARIIGVDEVTVYSWVREFGFHDKKKKTKKDEVNTLLREADLID